MRNIAGLTLLETMLVIVIGSAIFVMGLSAYRSHQLNTSALKVQFNVATIMRGAANYYYANCKATTQNPSATLDPANSAGTRIPIDVADLVTSGYLASTPPNNPLVESYIVQFNRQQPDPTKFYCSNRSDPSSCNAIGTSIVWRIEVAAKLRDQTKAEEFLKLTGATCLTTGTTTVTPCATANPTSTAYLAWEVLPSMVSTKNQSILWMSNPIVKQMKQDLESPSVSIMLNNPTTQFLCGS